MAVSEPTAQDRPDMPRYVPRLLGAAFLIVILTSLSGGVLLSSAVGTGSITDILGGAAHGATLLRASVLADLVTSLGIVVLAALLYVVLSEQDKAIALVALGCWLAEALFMAISKIGTLALIPVSQAFVGAGAPEPSAYQPLGEFLYQGVVRNGYTIHMFFYCSGGLLWYSLLYRSRYVPRAISLFGLVAVLVGLAGIVAELSGSSVPIVVYLPLLPFELTMGTWLLLRGITTGASMSRVRRVGPALGSGPA
jgi:hypothetical protein